MSAPRPTPAIPPATSLRVTFGGLVDMLTEVGHGGPEGAAMCRAVAIILTGYYRSPAYAEAFAEVRDMMAAEGVNPGTVAGDLLRRHGGSA